LAKPPATRSPAKRATSAKPASAANAQIQLTDAVQRLDLPDTLAVCRNAGVQPDLASFLVALAAAMTQDADRHDKQQGKQAAKNAGLPFPGASLTAVETSSGRGVAKMELDSLARAKWVEARENLLITGPVQSGKSYVASALAKEVQARGHTVMYRTAAALLDEWHTAFRESRAAFDRLRAQVREVDLLVLDNFGEGNVYAYDFGYLRELITERFDEEGKSLCIASSGNRARWEEWMSQSDEGRAVSARITNAFHKLTLLRGPK
jgi:DNA replication protein DnaC